MAGLHYVISGLDMLQDYPNIKEYIKHFDGAGCFMYTTNIDPHYNAELEKQMTDVLDPHGMHSGRSWGYMLSGIQSVLKGTLTRESIEEKIVEYEKKHNELKNEREEFRIERDDSDKHL